MATMLDLRRTDLRDSAYHVPYWITSARMVGADCEDLGACLFSFPTAGKITIVHEVVLQVEVVFTAGTVLTIGSATILTDAVTTAGTITNVDADEYILNADFTLTSTGYYGPTTGTGSDWLGGAVSKTWAAPRFISGLADNVPCVYALFTHAQSILAGVARLHMLITNIPGK